MTIPIETRITRYNAWRERRPIDTPLIGLAWEPDVEPLPGMLDQWGLGTEISPEQIEPEQFLPHIANSHQQAIQLQSDVIQGFGPAFGKTFQ